jgi:hypothetical protein
MRWRKGLAPRACGYSAHFVDAIAWGLALEEAARPRSVAQWRDVLFGQKNLAAQPKACSAAAAAKTPRARATQQSPSDQAQRAIAIASAMAESRRGSERSSSPWRWLMPAAIVLTIAVIGLRALPSQQPKSSTSDVRVITVAPVPISVPPRALDARPVVPAPVQSTPQPATDAAAPVVSSDVRAPATATSSDVGPGMAASPVDASAINAPAVPPATRALRPAVEQQLETRMHTFDPENTGLTREQMWKAFPRAAERFEEVDLDHDGRVTVNELIARGRASRHFRDSARISEPRAS